MKKVLEYFSSLILTIRINTFYSITDYLPLKGIRLAKISVEQNGGNHNFCEEFISANYDVS